MIGNNSVMILYAKLLVKRGVLRESVCYFQRTSQCSFASENRSTFLENNVS